MKKNKRILLLTGIAIGIAILIIGLVTIITPITSFFEIIEKEEKAYKNPFEKDKSRTYYLKPGWYDIYYYSEEYEHPGNITIVDSEGDDVFQFLEPASMVCPTRSVSQLDNRGFR